MNTTLLLSIASLIFIADIGAQNPDPRRAEARELMEKAQRAKAEGRGGEAEELMRKAKELQGAHGGHDDGKMDRARHEAVAREIEELHRAGKHEEAERLKRKLAGAGPGPGRPAEARERLAHVSQAIEHARAAGLKEEAAHLEQAARKMKEELARHSETAHGGPMPAEFPPAPIRELHEAMERMQGQMEKLSRAMGELREQVHAQQRGAEKKRPE
jgi:valyl-tRNA synthetase